VGDKRERKRGETQPLPSVICVSLFDGRTSTSRVRFLRGRGWLAFKKREGLGGQGKPSETAVSQNLVVGFVRGGAVRVRVAYAQPTGVEGQRHG
jgi:hypothetical protein